MLNFMSVLKTEMSKPDRQSPVLCLFVMGAVFLRVVGRRRIWKHCRSQHWGCGGKQVVCRLFPHLAFPLKGFAIGKGADRADAFRKVRALSLFAAGSV